MVSIQKTKGNQRITTDDIREGLIDIALENRSQDKKIVKVREMVTWLKLNKNIDVCAETVRNNGLCHKGYFEKKYPNSCNFNYRGDARYVGLVIKPQKFLQEVLVK